MQIFQFNVFARRFFFNEDFCKSKLLKDLGHPTVIGCIRCFISFLLKLLNIMYHQHFLITFFKKLNEHVFSAIIKVWPQPLFY